MKKTNAAFHFAKAASQLTLVAPESVWCTSKCVATITSAINSTAVQVRQSSSCASSAVKQAASSSGSSGSAASAAVIGLMGFAASALQVASADSQNPANIPVSETAQHPLDFDPVTNEHTAKMTMARSAAIDYYQAGRYELAETKFLEALEEAKLGFDAKDPHIASAKNNLAEFYRNTRQYDKAEVLYKDALAHLESIYGQKHWLYVGAMHNLALMYEARGDLGQAKTTMDKVLKLRVQMLGPKHFLYADTMYALGHIVMRTGQEKQGLNMMKDAVAILEDAETVQASVILTWLQELTSEYAARKRLPEAIACMRKAMFHMGNDKGETAAQASQLSDTLVDLLLGNKQLADAHAAQQACVDARSKMFGRDLVVSQSLLKLANLECKLNKPGMTASAAQNAYNAANLAQELLDTLTRPAVSNWLGGQSQDKALKRARAAHVLASALKFLATEQQLAVEGDEACGLLDRAVAALEGSTAAAVQQLQRAAGGAASSNTIDELAETYVESQLLLLDCIEALCERLAVKARAGDAAAGARSQALQQKAEAVARQLTSA